MLSWRIIFSAFQFCLWMLNAFNGQSAGLDAGTAGGRTFAVRGVVREVAPDEGTVVIQHEAISNYMDAMTMPFKVKDQKELADLQIGDAVAFQLHVAVTVSWVDQIVKIGTTSPSPEKTPANYTPAATVNAVSADSLLFYKFTNELGRAVSLDDYHGQALGVTFFYSRCPLPDYCPRLSKNFQEASLRLAAMPNAPTNWHFISITFDPANDTPAMLQAYGASYSYDPNHWSFFTGPPDMIAALARACGVEFQPDAGTINHNFRTLIVDAAGHLQMIYPVTGNLSDSIVDQMLKAATVTNQPVTQSPK